LHYRRPKAITLTDALKILNNTKNRKASEINNNPMELWKYGGKAIYIKNLRLFNVSAQGKIPSDWHTSVFVPIHKKVDKSQYSNYRRISFLAKASKIHAAILNDKLKITAEERIEE
jgi:hypothetical protein